MANIEAETLTYEAGGRTLASVLARNTPQIGKRPGIVIFSEWWGLNDYIKGRAREIAELGYVALAADVYGEGQRAANADEAAKLMNGLFADMAATSARIQAAVETLRARPEVDATRLGAMGYCLGGALSLHAARLGLDLKGVASFHGSLGSTHEAKPGDFKAKVLVCHGDADKFVSDDDLTKFKQEMTALGVDLTFKSYPGAMHGFTNPDATRNGERNNLPLRYDEGADRQSWSDMKAFWQRVFA
jgi:dienelactone hydrolase